MFYTDECYKILNCMVKGEIDENYYENLIISEVKDKIKRSEKIVFCGTLPFISKFLDFIKDNKEIYFFDNCCSEGLYLQCPMISITDLPLKFSKDTLFIVLSRSMIEFYNYIIMKTNVYADVIYYSALELAYPSYFTRAYREDYSISGIIKEREYIKNNAAELIDVLNLLADATSKEIFSRIILFRLTYEIKLNIGVKSAYDEYIEEDIISFNNDEIIVDGGGYVGDTLYDFNKYFSKHRINYEYHLFEPSMEAYLQACNIKNSNNIHYYNACLGDKNTKIFVSPDVNMTLTLESDSISNKVAVDMVRLDDCLQNIKITYIKMDIEGSEEIALLGAQKLIRENSPKLAICIYHKYDDILKLIYLVKELVAEHKYSFYVQAQKNSVVTEMVLYAIP